MSKQYFGLQKAKWVHALYCCYMQYGVHVAAVERVHIISLLLADVQLSLYEVAASMLPAQELWAVQLCRAQGSPTDQAEWVLESNHKGLIKGVPTDFGSNGKGPVLTLLTCLLLFDSRTHAGGSAGKLHA